MYKVNKLKSNYENNEVLGGRWKIIIVYVGGKTVVSNGSSAFPNKISESVE